MGSVLENLRCLFWCWWVKMASLRQLKYIAQTASSTTLEKSRDLDAVRASIYEIAINAFMKEVLTLNRMHGVILAVREGVDDGVVTAASGSDDNAPPKMQQCAYRGLCTAADEGLAAIGLAYSEYARFHRYSLPASFGSLWLHEVRALRQQIDQITLGADWTANSAVASLQRYWFEKLLNPVESYINAEEASALGWDDRFFQVCGYEALQDKNNFKASLMLLGLLTSGALMGMRSSQAVP
jgi:hypothetical protein